MIFTGIGFIPLQKTSKNTDEESFQGCIKIFPFIPNNPMRGHCALPPLGEFMLKIKHLLGGSFSALRSLKVLLSRCFLWKQWDCQSFHSPALPESKAKCLLFLSVESFVCLSERQQASGASPLQHLREHLWNIKATEGGRVPAIRMWPCAGCFLNALLWNLVLKAVSLIALPGSVCLSPCLRLASKRTPQTLSFPWDFFFFYNNCSVSPPSSELCISNCGTYTM